MNDTHIDQITETLGVGNLQVQATAELLEQGATVPFIARYRKEATGSLDEVAITFIRDRLAQLAQIDLRKAAILKSLQQHGHLTEELKDRVHGASTLAELEDLYLPYRPKRRTRGTAAREKGLEPLALLIFDQQGTDPRQAAASFLDPEKGVTSIEEALAGARDIMAELINEDTRARAQLRELFLGRGMFRSAVIPGKEISGVKYKDYFDWEEPAATAPSHRILAMRRGEKEEILDLTVAPPVPEALETLERLFVKGETTDSGQVREAVHDCYARLLSRSMETELRLVTREKADVEAIRVFTENLRQLLLAPPLGAKRVMGIDPGFRTGCKLVCLDEQGGLLHHGTIFPHLSESKAREAQDMVKTLCERFRIQAVAVGNGTAGRETEKFIKQAGLPTSIRVLMVNESGASIYSASETAREEFPELDLTVRGAVSIGRRLTDPLAELVKIDPKSIGVGQYQHDVDQVALRQSLDDVVVSCVNAVGVEVNTASVQLLTYVSGLGPQLARNMLAFRSAEGPFTSRAMLTRVPRLGPKAFEQCAGFLRIRDGENPLDASAVHPESYTVVDRIARDLNCRVSDLMQDAALREKIDLNRYVTPTIGLPTLKDILSELAKPGRDPRQKFEDFAFDGDVNTLEDLKPGMNLPGIVTNVTAFGAFVDVGVHQDGLVHISELADRFVKDPAEIVKVHQKVNVRVLDVDRKRKRIALSMKKSAPSPPTDRRAPKRGGMMQPGGGKTLSPPKGKPAMPFNNPFADLFNKSKR